MIFCNVKLPLSLPASTGGYDPCAPPVIKASLTFGSLPSTAKTNDQPPPSSCKINNDEPLDLENATDGVESEKVEITDKCPKTWASLLKTQGEDSNGTSKVTITESADQTPRCIFNFII